MKLGFGRWSLSLVLLLFFRSSSIKKRQKFRNSVVCTVPKQKSTRMCVSAWTNFQRMHTLCSDYIHFNCCLAARIVLLLFSVSIAQLCSNFSRATLLQWWNEWGAAWTAQLKVFIVVVIVVVVVVFSLFSLLFLLFNSRGFSVVRLRRTCFSVVVFCQGPEHIGWRRGVREKTKKTAIFSCYTNPST